MVAFSKLLVQSELEECCVLTLVCMQYDHRLPRLSRSNARSRDKTKDSPTLCVYGWLVVAYVCAHNGCWGGRWEGATEMPTRIVLFDVWPKSRALCVGHLSRTTPNMNISSLFPQLMTLCCQWPMLTNSQFVHPSNSGVMTTRGQASRTLGSTLHERRWNMGIGNSDCSPLMQELALCRKDLGGPRGLENGAHGSDQLEVQH
jgi:hypothetical protein